MFLFNTLWGFNYYSLSLASELKMDIGRYSVETLRLATESFVVELNAISSEIEVSQRGKQV